MRLHSFEDVMRMHLAQSKTEASRFVMRLAEKDRLEDAILSVIESMPTRATKELRDWVNHWEHGPLEPVQRVQIIEGSSSPPRPNDYWKPHQFGYAIGYSFLGGMVGQRRSSKHGEVAYMVSKTKGGRGGATWFLEDELRFTSR
jgi:hypothetical protein